MNAEVFDAERSMQQGRVFQSALATLQIAYHKCDMQHFYRVVDSLIDHNYTFSGEKTRHPVVDEAVVELAARSSYWDKVGDDSARDAMHRQATEGALRIIALYAALVHPERVEVEG